jgi:hypothetical protein
LVELEQNIPRSGREQFIEANAVALSAALAASGAVLFIGADGRPTWLDEGKLVRITDSTLPIVIEQHLCAGVLIRGERTTLEARSLTVPYFEDTMRKMLTAREKRGGGLVFYLPKLPLVDAAREAAA